jgi:MFS transporter, DHA2 family, metal-tetracycline-proton antiporter
LKKGGGVMDQNIDVRKTVPWILYLIFFAVLNETVFNVSTPAVARQFSLSPSGVSWMMTIFMIFFGIGSVIYGRLSDIFSLKKLIFTGTALYVTGSIMGFLFQFSYPMVIVSRAIQGMGGSSIPALIFVIVARHVGVNERGKIFGLITSTVSFAVGLGPVIGGTVSRYLHWHFLFLIPVLILAALPFISKRLPDEPGRNGKIDFIGAILVSLSIGSLVCFLNFVKWYYLVFFAIAVFLAVVNMLTVKDPFIKPGLFLNSRFRNGVISGFSLFSIVIGIFFLTPLLITGIYGYDTGMIGLVLFPGAISSVAVGPIAGNLADKRGNLFVMVIGMAILGTGIISLALFTDVSIFVIAVSLLLINSGFSFFQTALANSVSQSLPASETGAGMGVFNLIGIVSGAIGTAVAGKSLASGWLAFQVLPTVVSEKAYDYSNIMLVFLVIMILGSMPFIYGYLKTPSVKEAPECLGIEEC